VGGARDLVSNRGKSRRRTLSRDWPWKGLKKKKRGPKKSFPRENFTGSGRDKQASGGERLNGEAPGGERSCPEKKWKEKNTNLEVSKKGRSQPRGL